ncbi:MAG: hypothetical protein J1F23_05225 [Oscillospiraceae bacterium]|nr:hypothetical protein [Oscillospiraceae bacterium]
MSRKREWDDDDGRTIASMSGVGRQNLFIPRKNPHDERELTHPDTVNIGENFASEEETPENDRPWDESGRFSKQESRWYALGALRAALLIGLAFIVGLGLTILLMILFWS